MPENYLTFTLFSLCFFLPHVSVLGFNIEDRMAACMNWSCCVGGLLQQSNAGPGNGVQTMLLSGRSGEMGRRRRPKSCAKGHHQSADERGKSIRVLSA